MTTTEDLRQALAAVEAASDAAALNQDEHIDSVSASPHAGGRDDDDHDIHTKRLLVPYVELIMDMTIGRFQAVQHSATLVPEFLVATRHEMERLLRDCATTLRHGGAKLDDTIASQLIAAQATIEDFRDQKNRLRSSENFLRSLGSELIQDVSTKTQQVLALQGVVKRRDALLSDQRKAYLRELTHLRSIIQQLEAKGTSGLSDATFYNWHQDDLAQQMEQELGEETAAAMAEERAKFAKELESQEAKFAKMEEDLRRQLVSMENQLRQLQVPVPVADVACETDTVAASTAEVPVQTDDVVVLSEVPPTPPPVDQLLCPHCGIRYGAESVTPTPQLQPSSAAPSPLQSPRNAHPRASSVTKGGKASAAPSRGSNRTPKTNKSAPHESPRQLTSQTPTFLDSTPMLGVSNNTAVNDPSDLAALRAELQEQRLAAEELRSQLERKSTALTAASKRKLESDDARRRGEQQLIRKLQEDVKSKEALLEQKNKELAQLEEETRRWFEQYKASQPSDQVPVNYATLRKVNDAVDAAEVLESEYRTQSWTLIAMDVKHQRILEGLRHECLEAERHKDTLELRSVQRAFDAVSLMLRQRAARVRLSRNRKREEANRAWDAVLYFARLLHHPQEALAPPPRYYASTDTVSNGLPVSPPSRPRELLSMLHNHTLQVHKGQLLSQQMALGPAAGPAVYHPELLPVSPRDQPRPGTAPAARPTAASAEASEPVSPFVIRVRNSVQGHDGAPRTVGRPSSAIHSPKAPAFSPSALRGLNAAAKRQALVQLMRYDQDLLAVHNRRHIESLSQSRMSRGSSQFSAPDAGVHQTRLVASRLPSGQ